MATGYTTGDPGKVDITGDTLTGPLTLPGPPTLPLHAATKAYVDAAPGGGGIAHVNTGLITSGNITCTVAAFAQIGTDLTIAAAVGDVLEVEIEALTGDTPAGLVLDAATRVAGADINWFGSGGSVGNYPGGVPNWYISSGRFDGPRGRRAYVVAAGDIAAGAVTVRVYGRGDGGSRDVLASASWPLRIKLYNLGPVVA